MRIVLRSGLRILLRFVFALVFKNVASVGLSLPRRIGVWAEQKMRSERIGEKKWGPTAQCCLIATCDSVIVALIMGPGALVVGGVGVAL